MWIVVIPSMNFQSSCYFIIHFALSFVFRALYCVSLLLFSPSYTHVMYVSNALHYFKNASCERSFDVSRGCQQ